MLKLQLKKKNSFSQKHQEITFLTRDVVKIGLLFEPKKSVFFSKEFSSVRRVEPYRPYQPEKGEILLF